MKYSIDIEDVFIIVAYICDYKCYWALMDAQEILSVFQYLLSSET